MRIFENAVQTLKHLELIRYCLGYSTLPEAAWHEFHGLSELSLAHAYYERANAIERERAIATKEDVSSLARQFSGIEFTTPNMVIVAGCKTNTIWVKEAVRPIAPGDCAGTAMAILTGYLGANDGIRNVYEGEPVIDPRISARLYLEMLLGRTQAARLIDSYTPFWRGWQVEQELFDTEALARSVRAERDQIVRTLEG